MLEIAESSNPGVEICSVTRQILWCIIPCAGISAFVILTPGIGIVTFPVGGRNVLKLKNIAVGEVCKDVVCCAIADDSVEGEQGLKDDLVK